MGKGDQIFYILFGIPNYLANYLQHVYKSSYNYNDTSGNGGNF